MSFNEGSGCNSEWSLLLNLERVLTSFVNSGHRAARNKAISSVYEVARNTAVRIHDLDVECETLRR